MKKDNIIVILMIFLIFVNIIEILTVSSFTIAKATTKTYILLSDGRPCLSDDECVSGICLHEVCREDESYCGDGYFDLEEDCSSCPEDCKDDIESNEEVVSISILMENMKIFITNIFSLITTPLY